MDGIKLNKKKKRNLVGNVVIAVEQHFYISSALCQKSLAQGYKKTEIALLKLMEFTLAEYLFQPLSDFGHHMGFQTLNYTFRERKISILKDHPCINGNVNH